MTDAAPYEGEPPRDPQLVELRALRIEVRRSTPDFERLDVPRAITWRARRLNIRVAASAPAHLTITGRGITRRRIAVGIRSRRITLRIKPSERALMLNLHLTAERTATDVKVTVRRRR